MERLNKLSEELAEKKSLLNSKIEEVRAGVEDDATDVADIQAGMEEVKQLKTDIEDLSSQIDTLNEALDLEPEAPAEDAKDVNPEPKPEDAKSEEKRDGEDIETPDEPEDDTDEETRSGKDITNMEAVIGKQNSAFEDFLKSGEVRDGLTTVDGAVVIPKEILDIQNVPNDPTQLASYVNRVAVTSGVGSLPVLAKNTARLASTAELAQNPELAKLSLTGVDYKALTYRGVLPVSMEMLQDAPEIESIVSAYVSEAKALTEQYKIGEVLQKAAAVTVSDVDGIKDAFNKGLSNYNRMFVVSESFFAEIDKVKDADGRYLLQDSITSPSGKQLLGAPVVVVADDVLGVAGGAHAFVGDVKAFALEAMRSDIAVEWQDDDIFGKKLAVALRADWQVADAQAGKFLTFAPAASTK
ncbi:phage major capsid protein [Weissella confusa]|uniref:phage major capsid protein n=1 Tax=Weissella confusa TaxID=1583 RepID=UPI0018F26151|nr:phage major capsid protein [Weissella confusa]MBJ7624276.1 phage major capsid protein [Weissella confusa]